MRRRRLRFTSQLLLLQLAVVAAVVLVGFGLFAGMVERGLRAEYGDRALAIARSVATDDELRALVADYSADHSAAPDTSGAARDRSGAGRRRGGAGTDRRAVRGGHR